MGEPSQPCSILPQGTVMKGSKQSEGREDRHPRWCVLGKQEDLPPGEGMVGGGDTGRGRPAVRTRWHESFRPIFLPGTHLPASLAMSLSKQTMNQPPHCHRHRPSCVTRTTAVAAHWTLSCYSCSLMSSSPPSGQSNVFTSFKQGNVIRDVKPWPVSYRREEKPSSGPHLASPDIARPLTLHWSHHPGHWSLATPQGHFQPPSLFAAPGSLLGSLLLPRSTSAYPTSSRFLRSPLITSLHL